MGVPVSLRSDIYERSGGRCEQCGVRVGYRDWQAHHRKPRRMGGRAKNRHVNTIANLVVLCPECHARIESHRTWAIGNGFLLRETDVPEEVPVLLMGRRLVLLGYSYTPVEEPVDTPSQA